MFSSQPSLIPILSSFYFYFLDEKKLFMTFQAKIPISNIFPRLPYCFFWGVFLCNLNRCYLLHMLMIKQLFHSFTLLMLMDNFLCIFLPTVKSKQTLGEPSKKKLTFLADMSVNGGGGGGKTLFP